MRKGVMRSTANSVATSYSYGLMVTIQGP